ncbi:MAG: cation/multidrug efflux pump [Gammaproteobacteria bacterium]
MDSSTLTLYIATAVLVIVAIIGVVLFFSGFARLLNGRFLNGPSRSLGGLVLLLLVAFIVVVAVDLRTYFALTYEKPVATIRFKTLGPEYFHAQLKYGGDRVLDADLHGDEWQLDARVIKWSGFATVLGFKTLYRLDRLSGRYSQVAEERQGPHSAVSLTPDSGWPDTWSWAHRYGQWLPWVDASYGSGVYLPMADGAEYQVSLSTTGLLARPGNAIAQQATAHW